MYGCMYLPRHARTRRVLWPVHEQDGALRDGVGLRRDLRQVGRGQLARPGAEGQLGAAPEERGELCVFVCIHVCV